MWPVSTCPHYICLAGSCIEDNWLELLLFIHSLSCLIHVCFPLSHVTAQLFPGLRLLFAIGIDGLFLIAPLKILPLSPSSASSLHAYCQRGWANQGVLLFDLMDIILLFQNSFLFLFSCSYHGNHLQHSQYHWYPKWVLFPLQHRQDLLEIQQFPTFEYWWLSCSVFHFQRWWNYTSWWWSVL